MYPSLHEKIQFPGRIPPNTSLNFILTVASIYGLILFRRQNLSQVTHFITGILGSLINTFACISILGYITGLTGIYNWGYFSGMGMTLMAATGFLILGSGIIATSWYEEHDGWTVKSKGAITISVEAVHLTNDFIKAYGYGSTGKHACVSVTDTGAGIAEDFSSKIFDPFFTTKEVGKGTGLGLSVVYGIIKGHNAYIDVMSREGKGTTFKIYFPVIEQPAIKTERNVELVPAKGTETILIAEDDEDIQDVMKSVLEESGYNIIIATDGEDAVNKFRENRSEIHLLILDVIMPKKNGGEAFKEIRAISPQIKTIFISGYTREITDNQHLPDKDFVLMEKPVKPFELARKVKEVLGASLRHSLS